MEVIKNLGRKFLGLQGREGGTKRCCADTVSLFRRNTYVIADTGPRQCLDIKGIQCFLVFIYFKESVLQS